MGAEDRDRDRGQVVSRAITPIAPVITVQPADGAYDGETPLTLSVTFTGLPTPAAQWFQRGTATAIDDAGGFDTDDTDIALADGALINVGDVLEAEGGELMLVQAITRDVPAIATVVRGYAGTTPETLGDTEVIEHWDIMAGQTATTVDVEPAEDTQYRVRVSNTAGAVMSDVAVVTVANLPEMHQLAADLPSSDSATYETAFTIPVAANTTYFIKVPLYMTAAATTTGMTILVSGPVAATGYAVLVGHHETGTNPTAAALGATITTLNSLGATEDVGCLYVRVANGANAGNVTIQFKTEVNASAFTWKAGTHAIVWDASTGVMHAASGDVATADGTNYSVVNTLTIPANSVYLVEAAHASKTASVGTAAVLKIEATNSASIAAIFQCPVNGAASFSLTSRVDNSAVNPGTHPTAYQGARVMVLVVTGESESVVTIEARSETQDTAVTIEAGAFAFARDVSGSYQQTTGSDIVNSTDTPATGFSYTLEADKHYSITQGVILTTSATSVGFTHHWESMAEGAEDEDFVMGTWNTLASVALTTTRAVVRDSTPTVPSDSVGTAAGQALISNGVVNVDGTGGTGLFKFVKDGGTSATQKIGSFGICEEVALAA